jgi:hypothetical protein
VTSSKKAYRHTGRPSRSKSIPKLTGYFTRLEDLDRRREKTPYKPNKNTDKSNKNQDGVKLRSRGNRKAENKSNDKSASDTAPSTNLTHMTPVNVRPRRVMISGKLTKIIKR